MFKIFKKKEHKIKPGQFWTKIYDEDNPFENTKVYSYEILYFQDGYVLYKRKDKDKPESESIDWFLIKAILNKDVL